VELASSEEIFNNPLHPYTKELLLAAMSYKATQREEEIEIHPQAALVDQGNGHYVISE